MPSQVQTEIRFNIPTRIPISRTDRGDLVSIPSNKAFRDRSEPSLAEMVRDPSFLILLASDGVSMDMFTGLVVSVRRKLEN